MTKKFFALIVLSALCFAEAIPAFASKDFENFAIGVLGNVIKEAAKSSTEKSDKKSSKKSKESGKGTPQAAEENSQTEQKSLTQQQAEELLGIALRTELDLQELGDNILAYNKPAKEFKLTKEERLVPDYDYFGDDSDSSKKVLSPIMYSRVCIKGKTIVIGIAGKDKKFMTTFIATGEPDFPPKSKEVKGNPSLTNYDGIFVGADKSMAEKVIGTSLENVTKIYKYEANELHLNPTNYGFTGLAYNDKKITELYFTHWEGNEMYSTKRTHDWARKKAQELGLVFESVLAAETLDDYVQKSHTAEIR